MSKQARGAANASRHKGYDCREVVTFRAHIAIGASGAASAASTVNGDQGYDDDEIKVTKNGTGTYDVKFPTGRRVFPHIDLYSPLKTVVAAVITAKSATAGTLTFKTLAGTNAAVDTEPASGDEIFLALEVVP